MKLKDYIESNPAVKERSNLSVHCVKTRIGTFYEEDADLYILLNDGKQILIGSFVDCWTVIGDNCIIYSGGLFESDDNKITVVYIVGDEICSAHGAVDSAGNLVYIEGSSIIKRNGAGVKTKLADAPNGKAYSVCYENGIVMVVQNYGDTGIIRSVFYDETGNLMEKETIDDLISSIQHKIYYGLLSTDKLYKASWNDKICAVKYFADTDVITAEGSVTCRYIERVISNLRRANLLNEYQARLFGRFKKIVCTHQLDGEFQNVILNVIGMSEANVFSSRRKNGIFSSRIVELMERCGTVYSTHEIREAFPDRREFEEMLKSVDND